MIHRFRSAITGLFVTRDQAAAQPDTTVNEAAVPRRVIDHELEAALRGRVHVGLGRNGIGAQDALRSIRDLLDRNRGIRP